MRVFTTIDYQELYNRQPRGPDDPADPVKPTDPDYEPENPDGTKKKKPYDPCELSDPGDTCGRLAQIEGSGSYTQDTNGSKGASGRYQIEQATAVGEMKKMGRVSSDAQGIQLWQTCRNSSSAECVKLQDDICKSYAGSMSGKNIREVYLQWNMGKSGANEILRAHADDGQVDNPVRIRKMDNQAWTKNNPSRGDTNKFLNGLDNYIKKRGIDPSSAA